MNISYKIMLLLLTIVSNIRTSEAFRPRVRVHHDKLCKKIRVQCKLFVKRNYKDIKSDKSVIIQNIKSVVTDDISNDILYYLKFYNLTNSEDNSYFYIIFYELINLSLSKKQDMVKSLPISLSNIMIYILIKNVIFQHFMHHK